mmetsp:Transcript_5528/g.8996  ORF Transcript_5528/g.8996 Transcript_5528/m.8996 type:complete len:853 (+) Transcript_5528:89-2647(+)
MGQAEGKAGAPCKDHHDGHGRRKEKKDRGSKDKGEPTKRLLDYYTVGEMLGQGTFGVVYACKPKGQDRECAVKMVDKVETPVDKIKEEAEFLRKMNHPNVIKCYDVIYEKCFVCIVMDRLQGGDLILGMQAHWKAKGRIPFIVSGRIASQMGASLHYLHAQNMIHRDVKGDNYLTDRKDITDEQCRVVLTDFGTGLQISPGQRLKEKCGTKLYWSPEFFRLDYSLKVDVWAAGVVVYGLLCGRFPFRNEAEANKKALSFSEDTPTDCQDLARKMLDKVEDKRISAAGVMEHPVVQRKSAMKTSEPEKKPPEEKKATEIPQPEKVGEACCTQICAGDQKKPIEEKPKQPEPARDRVSSQSAPQSAHDPNDEGVMREFGADHGVQERRFELVDRLLQSHMDKERSVAVKTTTTNPDASKHVWQSSFKIVDKRAGNSEIKYEWWSEEQVNSKVDGNIPEGGVMTKLEGATPLNESSTQQATTTAVIKKQLEDHGIDTTQFGKGEAKNIEQLSEEVQNGSAVLMLDATEHKKLVRVVDVVALRIISGAGSTQKYLIETQEVYADGRQRNLERLPATKKHPHENTKQTTERIVKDMVDLGACKVHFDFSKREFFESESQSPSYPGVLTVYRMEIVEGRISSSTPPAAEDWTHKAPDGTTKTYKFMEAAECDAKDIRLRAPDDEDETSALVQAPIGLNEEDLRAYLKLYKVDVTQFGQGKAKTLQDISAELMKGDSSLMHDTDGSIIRVVDVVLLKLVNAETKQILVQTEQVYPDGTTVTLNRLPGTKRRPDENQFITAKGIVARQLQINDNHVTCSQKDVVAVEQEKASPAYPSLRTVYRKRIVTAVLTRDEETSPE